MIIPAMHEYAGFMYIIDGIPSNLKATPLPDQHPSANKEKHKQAAVETFIQEHQYG
jgi:hypothetical protein